ncbi:hypothetical protein E4T42_05174 [Aureobasidium subglaciale]|nr:hypothetical protein E4T38_00546 [Aureobasidium subglaciale]KAI5231673.1 hypothetical protein E4T40_00357 [Aureobasidium subglaciale]KAI5234414.1 hypothetical protein E4T41_00545 [Aureobasidium subglaciale]KAI5249701.1 hypothetical protein E4T42_05174 [Aureobasidium subglaciale]KAI5268069.1 hypothetical protein E4T46_00545 [Aureobasidium subglaciale]
MSTIITPPEPRTLFPPLLACLPTAFMSPRPPPALLPLLSPILRQRVNLLAGNTSSGQGGWLNLLSWSSSRSSKLGAKIENLQLEAHPVSGELELEDIDKIGYKRVDEETLQSCLQVEEFGLLPVYVWCENDAEGGQVGGTTGWRLAELRAIEDLSDDIVQWTDSIDAANDVFESKSHPNAPSTIIPQQATAQDDDDDDDDYWASYDRTPNNRTPARTPAKRASPAPTSTTASNLGPTNDELEYFARYAAEVQPALDDHDPDEEHPETADSTLRGGELSEKRSIATPAGEPNTNPAPPMYASENSEFSATLQREKAALEAPRPTSPASSVDKLERGAEDMTRAEVGVKQFISTEMKSMFRLARSVGMGREEFERIIKTEIDVLNSDREQIYLPIFLSSTLPSDSLHSVAMSTWSIRGISIVSQFLREIGSATYA